MSLSTDFNPRAPCGARRWRKSFSKNCLIFQSTRPMRGATPRHAHYHLISFISIHAPHAGRDDDRRGQKTVNRYFNPRAPCGARPAAPVVEVLPKEISIHAPHAGRDLRAIISFAPMKIFQSTRPMRGATTSGVSTFVVDGISIHAPHAGRDSQAAMEPRQREHFNPRAPCGARQEPTHFTDSVTRISIHAPHAGRDSKSIQNYFTHFCDKRQFLDNFTQNAAF